jgi:hypothetical protein
MEWLLAEQLDVWAKVEVREEEHMERSLAEGEIGDGRVPGGIWATVDAVIESAERRLVLIGDELLE